MRNRCSVFVFIVLCLTLSSPVMGDDILLKCDESESNFQRQDAFCTISGFNVNHSHNVKMMNYTTHHTAIEFMKFYDSRLLYVPFKLFEHFPNLRTLDVAFTEILDIPRNTFASANYLSFLNMSNNNITTIDTSVFIGANSLIRMDLSRNMIATLNEFTFRGLAKIDVILLSGNRIKTLSKDIFLENQYLEKVALDNNHLEILDPEVFSRLPRIRWVNLANNRLIHLHPDTFRMAYGLENLFLNGNQLRNFSLDDKSILLGLSLDNNQLTSLVINSTKSVSAENNSISSIFAVNANFLERLILGKNNLTVISNITNLSTLIALDLSYNNIGPLNITTFDKLRRLRELNLRGTNTSKISFGMFSKQTSLETLDLSYNQIKDLNLNIFVPYMSKIKYLYIDGNNLTEIHGRSTFAYAFPGLLKLGLSKNQFNCTYLHYIISPPFLSTIVELHIEPETSDEESTHIRDITCTSTKYPEDTSTSREDSEIAILKAHVHRLEVYLWILKTLMLVLICACIALGLLKYTKYQRRRHSGHFGRNGSIVFRSTATMNSAMEH